VTIIEVRPYRNGWSVFETRGVESVFLDQEQAIDYAKGRACFRSGEEAHGGEILRARAAPIVSLRQRHEVGVSSTE
jgi:hypothetical protein